MIIMILVIVIFILILQNIKVQGDTSPTSPVEEINYNTKYIKKTLTVPAWLNELSEKKGINFSKVLQDALLEKTRKMPS